MSFKYDDTNIEHFLIEINLRKKSSFYHDLTTRIQILIETHFNYSKKGFDNFSGKFDNYILLDDFNSEISNKYLKAFCEF